MSKCKISIDGENYFVNLTREEFYLALEQEIVKLKYGNQVQTR